jgi:hypothetical protein
MKLLNNIMRRFWYRFKQFIETNITRSKFNLIKQTITGEPYDYGFLLQLEQAKLIEMRDYFAKQEYFDHRHDIRYINICISLLDILINTTYFDTPEETPYVNTRNAMRFYNPRTCKATVDEVVSYLKKYPNDLRYTKAETLYYEIRKQYTTEWWD